ncbi:MAG: hypothetical protein N2053_06040, partial [Chitinispirillaceae bacterium]|nr:hypothetical protein [Chitinispirillaceae bacterium]
MKIHKKDGIRALFFVCVFYCVSEAKVLDTLIIEGLTLHSENSVRHTVGLRKNGDVSSVDIQDAIKRLYELGLFKSIDFYTLSETDSTIALKVVVSEFPICEAIEYEGNKKIKKKELEEKCSIKKDQILTDAAIFDEKIRIIKMYEEKGYNLVEITPNIIPTKIPGKAIIKFLINEGPRVKIKKIVFKGNKEIKTSKLLWNFKTKESRWWRSGDFKREEYRKHLDSLILFYNDLGYLDATIVKDSVWLADNKKDMMIEITIDEGKKYYT